MEALTLSAPKVTSSAHSVQGTRLLVASACDDILVAVHQHGQEHPPEVIDPKGAIVLVLRGKVERHCRDGTHGRASVVAVLRRPKLTGTAELARHLPSGRVQVVREVPHHGNVGIQHEERSVETLLVVELVATVPAIVDFGVEPLVSAGNVLSLVVVDELLRPL